MEKLQSLGLVKAIGVSNFTIPQLKALLETAKVVPAVNQGQFGLYSVACSTVLHP